MRAALLLAATLSSAALGAGGNPYLPQVKLLHDAHRFEQCLERVELAQKRWSNTEEDQVQLELFTGLCRLGLGHELDAQQHLLKAIRLDPTAHLPAKVGPKVELFYERLRARARAAPGAAVEPEAPPQPAPEATVEAPAPSLGLGERLSKQHLVAPLVLGGGALVAAVVGIGFGVQAKSLEGEANRALFESDIYRLGNSAKSNATAANVSLAVAGAALVAAVVVWWLLN